MSNKFRALSLCGAFVVLGSSLSGCASQTPDIAAFANDPATIGIHWDLTMPWGTTHMDITRVNSPNTASSANNSGVTINVPNGATVNPAPQKPVGGTTLSPGTPSTAPGP